MGVGRRRVLRAISASAPSTVRMTTATATITAPVPMTPRPTADFSTADPPPTTSTPPPSQFSRAKPRRPAGSTGRARGIAFATAGFPAWRRMLRRRRRRRRRNRRRKKIKSTTTRRFLRFPLRSPPPFPMPTSRPRKRPSTWTATPPTPTPTATARSPCRPPPPPPTAPSTRSTLATAGRDWWADSTWPRRFAVRGWRVPGGRGRSVRRTICALRECFAPRHNLPPLPPLRRLRPPPHPRH
mmetsp:Transcript_14093/g.28519  ORF Transcript_14093/g.28519 Transcript_14093/m.28519 type:complete len:241 (-) Transcript_14093:431-1153(-)